MLVSFNTPVNYLEYKYAHVFKKYANDNILFREKKGEKTS